MSQSQTLEFYLRFFKPPDNLNQLTFPRWFEKIGNLLWLIRLSFSSAGCPMATREFTLVFAQSFIGLAGLPAVLVRSQAC